MGRVGPRDFEVIGHTFGCDITVGFFGKAGLPLNPIYESGDASFEISVPTVHREEAEEMLDMTLGDKWKKKDH